MKTLGLFIFSAAMLLGQPRPGSTLRIEQLSVWVQMPVAGLPFNIPVLLNIDPTSFEIAIVNGAQALKVKTIQTGASTRFRERVLNVMLDSTLKITLPETPLINTHIKVIHFGLIEYSAEVTTTLSSLQLFTGSGWKAGDKLQVVYFY